MPRPVLERKLQSEVATLQFLSRHTRVPVPALIGYDEGTDEFPPFLIIEHCEGWRLNVLWGAKVKNDQVEETIIRSLTEIQHELLRHPFDRIGMLDVSAGINDEQKIVGPVSLDALEHSRDGVIPHMPTPFETAGDYFDYKVDVAIDRLHNQRNSIDSVSDGRRKFLNPYIIREYIQAKSRPEDAEGPFYLTHPDLHGANVIIDMHTFRIVSILDWKGACILPFNHACALPQCLDNILCDDLLPHSDKWRFYGDRARCYSKLFAEVAREQGTDFAVADTITTGLFFTWAINDVRTLDSLIWQHLAPSLYPDLGKEYDRIFCCRHDSPLMGADAIKSVVDEFVERRLLELGLGPTVGEEVSNKMIDLQRFAEIQ